MSRLRKNLPTVPTVNHDAAHERLHYGGSMHGICRSHVTALVLLLGTLLNRTRASHVQLYMYEGHVREWNEWDGHL